MTDLALARAGRGRAWREEVRATLALSWPLIATNMLQTGLGVTDVILLGRLGPNELAASALGTNLYFPFAIFGIGVLSAIAPMVAREVGARAWSVRDVRRTFRQGLWTMVAITVPIWIVLWNAEPILLALGQEPDLATNAAIYLHAYQWALLPFLGYIVLRSFMAAMERPIWGLWAGLIGFVANAIAAWALIFGHLGMPRLELVGAGIATTFASTMMFAVLVLVVVLDRRFRRYRLFGRLWRPDWPRFLSLWRLGLPIGVTLVFEVSLFNAAVFLMGLISAASVAAHAIAIQIASLAFMAPLGFGQAVTVRVGRAFGAGDDAGVTRAGWTAFALGEGFMLLTAALMVFAPTLLISAFLDMSRPDNRPVIELAVTFLAIAALFQIADGAQAITLGMLRGLHDTRVPMLVAAFGYWGIGMPLAVVLAFPLGLEGAGIWMGLAAALSVVAVLLTVRWMMRRQLGLVPAGSPAWRP